jgi:hypothetical protein
LSVISLERTHDLLLIIEQINDILHETVDYLLFPIKFDITNLIRVDSQQNRPNVSQPTGQPVNNNRQFPTQQINLPQQTSAPMLNHPQHPLIHMQNQPQPRLPNVQPRMANPPTAMISNQTQVRLRDPQKFSQSQFFSLSIDF